MTNFQKNLIQWLVETEAEFKAEGLIPTLRLAIEKAQDEIESEVVGEKEVDDEPADFTGSNDAFGTDR